MILFSILWNDILPLFVFIGAGWFLDSKFKIDISTYSKLTILVVLPCFIFYSLYGYRGSSMEMAAVAAAVLLLLVQFLLSGGLGRLLHLQKGKFDEFRAVSTFSNSGHIGAALIMLIYSHPPFAEGNSHPYLAEALGTMAVLMIVMNMAVNVFGAALIRSRGASVSEFFRYLLKMPALYAALLAVLVRAADIPLEHTFLWPVLQLDKIIIGYIMLLIPGLAMTNAVRDILVGNTISGSLRLTESLLWAGALACGFMLAIWITGV